MTGVLDRARSDVAAGRAWKARDRLTGALAHRVDAEALDLLAQVHAGMGDLPAAGALWFVTGRDDEPARQATAAWRQRHGNDPVQLWYSLPRLAREQRPAPAHLKRLHRDVLVAVGARSTPATGRRGGSPDSAQGTGERLAGVLAAVVVVLLVVVLGVGAVTSVSWVVGGVAALLG